MKNLDILRSIAVLSVLFSHSVRWIVQGTVQSRAAMETNLGRFGVLIFFVHTALVLMMSMGRISSKPRWVLQFYLLRIFRIYPLSILCVVLVLGFKIPRALDT